MAYSLTLFVQRIQVPTVFLGLFVMMMTSHGHGLAAQEPARPDWEIVLTEPISAIPPTPEVHASTIVETPTGLVAAWFGGTQEGAQDVEIWSSRQSGCDPWSTPNVVATGMRDGKQNPCWNPVLYRFDEGPLILFYKVGPSPSRWWGMAKLSSDDGLTWTNAITLPESILGPIRNKPVRLDRSRLLAGSSREDQGWVVRMEEFQFPPLVSTESQKSAESDSIGRLSAALSDSRSWTESSPLNSPEEMMAIQPTILVHSPQVIQVLCRTRSQKIASGWSFDAGVHWSNLELTDMANPNSAIDAVRLTDGRFLLVHNPIALERNELVVSISTDGKNWKQIVTLENSSGEFSYPAVTQTSCGEIHIVYTYRRKRIQHAVIRETLTSTR